MSAIEMDYLDNRRRPIMAATCFYRGDLYQLHVVLTPNAFTAEMPEGAIGSPSGSTKASPRSGCGYRESRRRRW